MNTRLNIELGHSLTEWREMYDTNDYWDFDINEMLDGTIEPNEDILYWYIDGRLYETDIEIEK